MNKRQSLMLVVVVLAACAVSGCGQPAPVDQAVSKDKPNFSPAHKAMIAERKKQDGD